MQFEELMQVDARCEAEDGAKDLCFAVFCSVSDTDTHFWIRRRLRLVGANFL